MNARTGAVQGHNALLDKTEKTTTNVATQRNDKALNTEVKSSTITLYLKVMLKVQLVMLLN